MPGHFGHKTVSSCVTSEPVRRVAARPASDVAACGRTLGVEQARDAQVALRGVEGVLEALLRRARAQRREVEQLRPPAVQQRVERQPVRPR